MDEPCIELLHTIGDIDKRKTLIDQCVQLLNTFWPRSESAR